MKTAGFFDGPPDVAFEVVSPGDTYTEVEDKTRRWLRAGAQALVIIDPRTDTVRVHRASGVTNVADALTVDDILPDRHMPLSELFE